LAGGLGTRLASAVVDRPKVLAEVSGRPFLEYLLDQLRSAQFRNVILCTGHLGKQIEKAFGKRYKSLDLQYSREHAPLGTAGALRYALPLLKSETILVMNGDTYCEVDFEKFLHFHRSNKSKASIALSRVADIRHYGEVRIGTDGNILGFSEKIAVAGSGYVNAGIYLINRNMIEKIPPGENLSIEKDIFPEWVGKGFYGYKTTKSFIDIGTPERYAYAQKIYRRFVLLDRDGTVIKHKHHLTDIGDVELIPNAAKAIKKLNSLGLGVIMITNQSVVGHGLLKKKDLHAIHAKIRRLLAKEGASLDGIYVCPHKPEDNCSCRKPKYGLVKKAIKDHHFDPTFAIVVGDNRSDIELGKSIGATTILVKTGYGATVASEGKLAPDHIVNNLQEAAGTIELLM